MNMYLEVNSFVCVCFTAANFSRECICTLLMFSAFQYLEIYSTSGVYIHDTSPLSVSPSIWHGAEIMEVSMH